MSNLIENITFLHCPEDRRVKVRIPVLVSAHVPPTCAADACMLTMLKSHQPCLGKSALMKNIAWLACSQRAALASLSTFQAYTAYRASTLHLG